jgi:hypothetical protein
MHLRLYDLLSRPVTGSSYNGLLHASISKKRPLPSCGGYVSDKLHYFLLIACLSTLSCYPQIAVLKRNIIQVLCKKQESEVFQHLSKALPVMLQRAYKARNRTIILSENFFFTVCFIDEVR